MGKRGRGRAVPSSQPWAAVVGMGQQVFVPAERASRPVVPVPGKHLWIVAGMWSVDPVAMKDSDGPVLLDSENLLHVSPPACFGCEQAYTAELAARPCVVVP